MRARGLLVAAGAAALGAALWWRKNPSACPYSQRFFVAAPHPVITRDRLAEILEPRPGERMLEVGPGTGYYTLELAGSLGQEGSLEILDLQQEMLDHTMRRAGAEGIENIDPMQGDARSLPYPDDSFDGAFLVTVLGEIPDQQLALNELQRVLRPGARLVVGELFGDPHWVSPGALRRRAEAAGLRFVGSTGTFPGGFSSFMKAEHQAAGAPAHADAGGARP
jgi:ubiquinone/menaquinone biosynthesis C-methylase UbiE